MNWRSADAGGVLASSGARGDGLDIGGGEDDGGWLVIAVSAVRGNKASEESDGSK